MSGTTAHGRKKEVGVQMMNAQVARMLNIPNKNPSELQQETLDHIGSTYDLSDFQPMNSKYGPISGMTDWERLLRAYDLGLLRPLDLYK